MNSLNGVHDLGVEKLCINRSHGAVKLESVRALTVGKKRHTGVKVCILVEPFEYGEVPATRWVGSASSIDAHCTNLDECPSDHRRVSKRPETHLNGQCET